MNEINKIEEKILNIYSVIEKFIEIQFKNETQIFLKNFKKKLKYNYFNFIKIIMIIIMFIYYINYILNIYNRIISKLIFSS